VASGADANGDAVLDAGEIASTTYLCNGGARRGRCHRSDRSHRSHWSHWLPRAGRPGLTWVDVGAGAVTARANTGYLADSASLVTVTLPTTLAVGDVVRVSGIGGCGWTVAQQAGQTIATAGIPTTAIGANWTSQSATHGWTSIAASSDGTKLVAAEEGGQLYTSTDGGATWTPRDTNRNWHALASSWDGSRLVAVVYGGQVYTSTDAGATWTANDSKPRLAKRRLLGRRHGAGRGRAGRTALHLHGRRLHLAARDSNRDWHNVTSSADGARLAAAEWNGQIYTSTDSGASWTPRDTTRRWTALASSADGTKLVAAENNGQVYVSLDSGRQLAGAGLDVSTGRPSPRRRTGSG